MGKVSCKGVHPLEIVSNSEEIINTLISILFDQVDHSLSSSQLRGLSHQVTGESYLWHDWFTVTALHISERHFSTLVLVDTQFRIVDIGNLLQGDYSM